MKTITKIVSAALFSTMLMSGVVNTSALSQLPYKNNNGINKLVAQRCENTKATDVASAKNSQLVSEKTLEMYSNSLNTLRANPRNVGKDSSALEKQYGVFKDSSMKLKSQYQLLELIASKIDCQTPANTKATRDQFLSLRKNINTIASRETRAEGGKLFTAMRDFNRKPKAVINPSSSTPVPPPTNWVACPVGFVQKGADCQREFVDNMPKAPAPSSSRPDVTCMAIGCPVLPPTPPMPPVIQIPMTCTAMTGPLACTTTPKDGNVTLPDMRGPAPSSPRPDMVTCMAIGCPTPVLEVPKPTNNCKYTEFGYVCELTPFVPSDNNNIMLPDMRGPSPMNPVTNPRI